MERSLSTRNPREIRGCEAAARHEASVKKCHVMESCHENDISHQTLWVDFHEKQGEIHSGNVAADIMPSLKDSDCRDSDCHNSLLSVYPQRHVACRNRISFCPDYTVSCLVRTTTEDKLSTRRAVGVQPT